MPAFCRGQLLSCQLTGPLLILIIICVVNMTQQQMTSTERQAIVSLASLYALRMLGLFMILPVMMLEGDYLLGATPELLGIAMGAYGLTQAFLQIPAGMLSDYFGRKPIIIAGLLVFAAGSLVAANAESIEMMIVGRMLQGAGAIASAIMALVTDLTQEENRMKAMSMIGASIGLSFSIALVMGPLLVSFGGMPLIFMVTAIAALGGIAIVIWFVPNAHKKRHRDAMALGSDLIRQAANPVLWSLNIGIFLLHALLVALFVALPPQLVAAGLLPEGHAWLYLPVLLAAFVIMVPFIIVAEKKRQMKSVVMIAIVTLALALILMSQAEQLWLWVVALLIFFIGFNILEASLPSWLSKIAPPGSKGSVMGIYSTAQFLGAFVGGWLGAKGISQWGDHGIFLFLACFMALWLLVVIVSPKPQHLTSARLELNVSVADQDKLLAELLEVAGVADAVLVAEDAAIYLKVDSSKFQYQQAKGIISAAV